jgi:hypothetical protein
MNSEKNPKDIKYALIAIDPTQEGEMKDILHFCGYWEEPGKREAEALLAELKTDTEFGLTDIADRLVIIRAPENILEEYKNDIINNNE